MSEVLGAQLPLLIVQLTTVGVVPSPAVTPVIVVVGEFTFVITPGPLMMLQLPVPTTGMFALIANVPLPHWAISVPASANVGAALLVRVTSSKLSAHTPLLIVQRKVALLPAGTPVTPLPADAGVVIVAVPLTTLHSPVPLAGTLPDNVKLPSLHCSWSTPAFDTLGAV